ncbi:hypothetical protein JCM11251_003195 [Rhodosporidiobolus azoricus]
MSGPSPASSRASLPLPAVTTSSNASSAGAPPSPGSGGMSGGGNGPTVRVLSSEEDLASRPRSTSRSSLLTGRTGSRESFASGGVGGRRDGAAPPIQGGARGGAGSATASRSEYARSKTPTSPIPSGARASNGALPGVLPSSAFLNPRFSNSPSSPPSSDSSLSRHPHRPLSAASIATTASTFMNVLPISLSPPTSPGSSHGGRQQGPIITRVSSAMSPSTPPPVQSPSSSSAHPSAAGRPLRPFPRRISADDLALSPEDVAADLAAGWRLAQQRRSSLDLVGVEDQRNGANTTMHGVFVVPVSQGHQSEANPTLSGSQLVRTVDAEKPFSALYPLPYPPSPSSPSRPLPTSRPTPAPFPLPSSPLLSPPLRVSNPPTRIYPHHPGRNRFFLRGRLISSGDNPLPFLVSLAVAVVLPGLFWAFNGDFLWNELGGGGKASLFVFAYLVLIMWSSMLKTALSDPGILPRNLDPHPTLKLVEGTAEAGGDGAQWRAEPKYVRVKGEGVVASKWCETCHTYRPPRTSHCRLCDNCVEHTDHHCAFLNNCIGRRTYLPFLSFLTSAVLSGAYCMSFSAWHVWRASNDSPEGWTGEWDAVGAIVIAGLSFVVWVPVVGLTAYHARLVWTNSTTVEMLRPQPDRRSTSFSPSTGAALPGNVWSLSSPWANCVGGWCAPGVAAGAGTHVGWREWEGVDARVEAGGDKEGA